MKDPIDDNLVMVSYLKSGRCWWILRVYNDDTFDYYLSCKKSKNKIVNDKFCFQTSIGSSYLGLKVVSPRNELGSKV